MSFSPVIAQSEYRARYNKDLWSKWVFDTKEHKLGEQCRYALLIPHLDSVYGLLLLKSGSVCMSHICSRMMNDDLDELVIE